MSAKKILIVEDEEVVRRFIKISLEFEGFKVYEASNGEEGIVFVQKELPDLVITDLMMPEMDGVAFYKKMKEKKETMSIPIIVLTAKDAFQDIHEAYKTGVVLYLTKPFDPGMLVQRVHEILS
ncbi:MAG: response regulator [Firmicutes bacterium]|nr:response regulator [Bacillota bacterium]